MSITAREAWDARQSLLWIAGRWPDLRARLRREGGNPLTGRVTGSATQPLVIDIGVSDLLAEIEDEARTMAHVLIDELLDADGQPWEPVTSAMPALLVEVAEHYGHWTTGEDRDALAFCDWAEEYREKVRATLERPAPPSYMGDCPQAYPEGTVRQGVAVGGEACDGALYLRAGRGSMRCPDCGQETSIEDQRAHVASTLAGLVLTQSEVRRALVVLGFEVPWSTVKDWCQVRPRRDGSKRPARLPEAVEGEGLYRLADAVTLAEERAGRMSA